MNVEKKLQDLRCTQEIRDIALWVLNLLHVRRLFDDDPNYDGEECTIFASSMCLWFYGCSLSPVSDMYRIELRLDGSSVEIAFHGERRELLACFKYSNGAGWIAYSMETDVSRRFVARIKHWYEESRVKDFDPLIAVCAECDATSPVVFGVIRSVIENAR